MSAFDFSVELVAAEGQQGALDGHDGHAAAHVAADPETVAAADQPPVSILWRPVRLSIPPEQRLPDHGRAAVSAVQDSQTGDQAGIFALARCLGIVALIYRNLHKHHRIL